MLAKLLDLFTQFLDSFKFLVVVRDWEVGVVLRFGKYHRTLPAGLHFKLPLHIESVAAEWTVPYPRQLAPQPLTTRDGITVVVGAVVTTRCLDARRLVCQSGGHEAAVLDSAAGTIAACVAAVDWDQLTSAGFLEATCAAVDEHSREWGLETMRVQFATLARCRPLCLVGHKPTDL